MISKHTTLTNGGRVSIPASMRKQLGLKVGDELILDLEGDTLRLRPLRAAINRAQESVRQYVDENTSLSKELIADRRREAAHD